MKHLVSAVLMLMLAAGAVLAQAPGGGGMQASGDTLMVTTPKGLFVLRNGVLAKFDPVTLKSGPVLELFGPMPAPPGQNATREERQAYNNEVQKRMAPPIMLVKDNALLVVIGDGFARIDQDTFKSDALDLRNPNAAPAAGRGFRQEGAPGYLLVGDTLYLLRGTELISIDVAKVKLNARGPLPKEMQPIQFNIGGFGGNRPGGDRPGGDRAGGNRAGGNRPGGNRGGN